MTASNSRRFWMILDNSERLYPIQNSSKDSKRFWPIQTEYDRFKTILTGSKRLCPIQNDSDRFKTILTNSKSKRFKMILTDSITIQNDSRRICPTELESFQLRWVCPSTLESVEYVQLCWDMSNYVGILFEFYKVLAWTTFWLIGPLDSEASRGQKLKRT